MTDAEKLILYRKSHQLSQETILDHVPLGETKSLREFGFSKRVIQTVEQGVVSRAPLLLKYLLKFEDIGKSPIS